MHCPTCGTKASTDQKFCRSCGMDLWIVSQLVASHLSVTDPSLLPVENMDGKPHRMAPLLFSGIAAFIIGMALLVANQHPDWIVPVSILLLLSGPLTAAYGVFSPRWQIKRFHRAPLSQPPTMPPAESRGLASAKAHKRNSIDPTS